MLEFVSSEKDSSYGFNNSSSSKPSTVNYIVNPNIFYTSCLNDFSQFHKNVGPSDAKSQIAL